MADIIPINRKSQKTPTAADTICRLYADVGIPVTQADKKRIHAVLDGEDTEIVQVSGKIFVLETRRD